jgi:hypothetical protein
MPKFSTATMEATRERVRPRERWRDEVQEDVNIMIIKKTGRQWPGTVGDAGRL